MINAENIFGLCNSFVEPNCSTEASKFIEENYDEVIRQVLKMGVHFDKVGDLVGDVYISLVLAEENGEGYNFNFYDTGITVEGFVYGRIKQYSKNKKYRNDITQVMRNGYFIEDIRAEEEQIEEITDEHIKRIKTLELSEKIKKQQQGTAVYAASTNGEDIDNMDSFQKAYATAGSYDDIDDAEMLIDLQEKISYCLEFEEQVGISILSILKNIDMISDELNSSIFNKLKTAVNYHDEFGETFREILEFSIKRRPYFEEIMSAY